MAQKDFLNQIYIVDALRTAIGGTNKSLKDFSAVKLASVVMREILQRNKVDSALVQEVILGNTVSAGAGQNLARLATCASGLSGSVPASTVNCVCGSGLQAAIFAIQALACRQSGIVLTGGSESSSQSPYLIHRADKDKKEVDSLINDGLWCFVTNKHMGELAEYLGEKFEISREEQDKFALESHRKACAATEQGKFKDEIVPIEVSSAKIFMQDERPRKETSLERLGKLSAAFKTDGRVTAGNSCLPSDGAAIIMLATEDMVKKYHLKPKARILGYASIAVDPQDVFTGAVLSTQECLKNAGLKMEDIELFEIVEAFAVQGIFTRNALKISNEKLNIYGGDVALGHPLGTSGSRALVTLIHALLNEKKKRGVVAVCLGGGGSIAMAVEVMA